MPSAYDIPADLLIKKLAEELKIPQITYIQKFELKQEKIVVERVFRTEEVVVIETKLPALLSVLKEYSPEAG